MSLSLFRSSRASSRTTTPILPCCVHFFLFFRPIYRIIVCHQFNLENKKYFVDFTYVVHLGERDIRIRQLAGATIVQHRHRHWKTVWFNDVRLGFGIVAIVLFGKWPEYVIGAVDVSELVNKARLMSEFIVIYRQIMAAQDTNHFQKYFFFLQNYQSFELGLRLYSPVKDLWLNLDSFGQFLAGFGYFQTSSVKP